MRVVWFRRAVEDLTEARSYVARDDSMAADKVVARIREAISLLSEHPGMGRPGRVVGTRELVITGTPYILPYRVKDKVIEILRVLHSARRWSEKLGTK